MVEYRYDAGSGRYLLMEVNGHLWGSLPLASACGAEFAWEAYRRQMLGHTAPAPPPRAGLHARDTVKETRRLLRLFRQRGRSNDPCFRPTPWRDLGRYIPRLRRPAHPQLCVRLERPGALALEPGRDAGAGWRRSSGSTSRQAERAAGQVQGSVTRYCGCLEASLVRDAAT
jgi:hypothetical protein